MILMTMKMMKVTKMMRRVSTRKRMRMIIIPMMRMRTRISTKVHARPPLINGYQQCCSNYS